MPNYLRQQSPWVAGGQLGAELSDQLQRLALQRQMLQMKAQMGTQQGMLARGLTDERQSASMKNQAAAALDVARQNYELGRVSDQQDAKARVNQAMKSTFQQNYTPGQFPAMSAQDAQQFGAAGGKAAIMGQAVSRPQSAEALMQSRNVGPGQIAANSFGDVTVQSPYSPVIPQGGTVYNNGVPQTGVVQTPRGGTTTMPDSSPPIFGQPVVPAQGRGGASGMLAPKDITAAFNSSQSTLGKYAGYKAPETMPGYRDATNNAAIFGNALKALLPHVLDAVAQGQQGQPPQVVPAQPSFGNGGQQQGAMSVAPAPVPQQSQRIRVRNPQGQTGTMDSSEPLPAGWQVLQ